MTLNNIKEWNSTRDLCIIILAVAGLIQFQELKAEPLIKSSFETIDLSSKTAVSSSSEGVLKINMGTIYQLGLNNFATIEQNSTIGANNDATIEQSVKSANNQALITQTGNLNQATITQNGLASAAYIYQAGQGNRAIIRQN
jgi:hypothetical protein